MNVRTYALFCVQDAVFGTSWNSEEATQMDGCCGGISTIAHAPSLQH